MALPVFIDRRVDPWLITLKVSYCPKGAFCVMVQEVLGLWTGMTVHRGKPNYILWFHIDDDKLITYYFI